MVASIITSSGTKDEVQNSTFRPIYYLGCKTNFTSAISAAIDEVDPGRGRLADLFAGTGAVGAALAATREVTTVDVQEYSRVLCSAVLRPPGLLLAEVDEIVTRISKSKRAIEMESCLRPLIDYERTCIDAAGAGDPTALVDLLESPPLAAVQDASPSTTRSRLAEVMSTVIDNLKLSQLWQSRDSMITRHFGGVYFSFRQAMVLDAILSIADEVEEYLRDTMKAAALSTASQIVNSVGKQFAQPIQPRNKAGVVKANLAKIVQRDRSIDTLVTYKEWLTKYAGIPRPMGTPQSIRKDSLGALSEHGTSFSVVYADPPYTRDHYSRFYHVLETMCLRDDPPISRVKKDGALSLSRGVYREDRYQSPFCIRSAAPSAFEALFKTAREHGLPLVLSYSPHEAGDGTHPRVVSMKQIVDLAHAYYAKVDVCVIEGSIHNKLNRSGLELRTRDHAEVILKCFR